MSIRIIDRDWDDEEYDSCGNTTVAILKINSVKIPLCLSCVDDLTEELAEFNKPHFCHQCRCYIPGTTGYDYEGSCTKHGYTVNNRHSCILFELREDLKCEK